MGAKTFTNNTNAAVTLQLIVRQGDDPTHILNAQSLVIQAGKSQAYTYSDSSNPYLNGLGVSLNANGNLVQSFQYVTTRGSAVDNLLNQNSMVVIAETGQSIVVTSHN
jgi:hypothetical protein